MLLRAWERKEKRTDQRFALIACTLANIHRSADDDPFDLRDFMPMTEKEREKREAEKVRESQQKLAAVMGTLAFVTKSALPKMTPEEQERAIAEAKTPAELAAAKAGVVL